MALDDLVMTIDSDAEDAPEVQRKPSKANGKPKLSNKAKVVDEGAPDEKDTLNPEFTFDLTGDIYDDVLSGQDGFGDLIKGSKKVSLANHS